MLQQSPRKGRELPNLHPTIRFHRLVPSNVVPLIRILLSNRMATVEEQPQLHSHRDTIVIYGSGALTENGHFPSGTRFKETAARHVDERGVGIKLQLGKKGRKGHVQAS